MTADPHSQIDRIVQNLRGELAELGAAREIALPASRKAIRLAGSSIRAVHGLRPGEASDLAQQCHEHLQAAQEAVSAHPLLRSAGFVSDAEKEYAEARLLAALVGGEALPDPDDLSVEPQAWMKGLAEAASELRRHLLDRLREGELHRGEDLLAAMDDIYGSLVTVDEPDAITGGLRRSVDALRGVLERTRSDVTTTVLQARLQNELQRR